MKGHCQGHIVQGYESTSKNNNQLWENTRNGRSHKTNLIEYCLGKPNCVSKVGSID